MGKHVACNQVHDLFAPLLGKLKKSRMENTLCNISNNSIFG